MTRNNALSKPKKEVCAMASRYFIEDWLRGAAKDLLRGLSIKNNESYHPHITLVRPFEIPGDEESVKNIIIDACKDLDPIFFCLQKAGSFDGKVSYIALSDHEKLQRFDTDLEWLLDDFVTFDEKLAEEKVLHATVEFRDDGTFTDKIEQYMLRLTVLKDKKIWFSYDFVTHQVLNREESLDRQLWYMTVHLFTQRYRLLPTRNGFQKIDKEVQREVLILDEK